MFCQSQDVQMTLNDRMLTANAQTKKAVDSSRAKLVGDVIYPNIDESKFSGLYSEVGSRPNIEIRQYVSALVLKRMYGLSESSIRRFRRKAEAYNEENHCGLIKRLPMKFCEKWQNFGNAILVDPG